MPLNLLFPLRRNPSRPTARPADNPARKLPPIANSAKDFDKPPSVANSAKEFDSVPIPANGFTLLRNALLIASAVLLSAAAGIRAQGLDGPGYPLQQTNRHQFDNGIAAVVEDRIITYQDIRQEAARLADQVRRASRTESEFFQRMQQLEQEIIQSQIDRVLIIKAFEERGMQIPASYIDNEINELLMREFDGDRSRLLDHLRERDMSRREFREETKEEIIVRYMRGQMRESEAVVSPVRIQKFYEENQERFRREESIHLRLIHLTGDTARETAETVLQKLSDGAEFAEMAREYSSGRRSQNGGSWGWLNVSDLREDWREVASGLEEGEYSDPIDAADSGLYILFVEERQEEGIAPLREVREEIEETLVSEMAREAQEKWLERLRRDAYVRYY